MTNTNKYILYQRDDNNESESDCIWKWFKKEYRNQIVLYPNDFIRENLNLEYDRAKEEINKNLRLVELTKEQLIDFILQNRLNTQINYDLDNEKYPWNNLNILSKEKSLKIYKELIKEYDPNICR